MDARFATRGPSKYRIDRRLLGALTLAAVSLPAGAQTAPTLGVPQSSVSAQGSAGALGSTTNCGDTVNGSSVAATGCAIGGATVAGAAGFGAVHASVQAQGGSGGSTFGSSGQVNAFFTDYFALRGPANTIAVIHGDFVIAGGLEATVSGAAQAPTAALASYSVQASLFGVNVGSDGNVFRATNGAGSASNTNGQTLSLNAPISFGPDGWAVLSVSVLAQLHAEGTARFYQECSNCPGFPGAYFAEAGFGHTIYWAGISSITVGGVPLTSYEYLASASGVDYRLSTEFAGPVSEPAPIALMTAGLIVLALRRRRSN